MAISSEMGERILAFDWSRTPLGPIESWPLNLKTTVGILLNSRYPMFVWWGREMINLYNDAYIPVLGKRHPDALGRPAPEIWGDIWSVVGPQAETVLNEGRATWNEERLLLMERHGFVEETYFTFSYSPVPGDGGGVAGVFCACTEDTARVLSERRLKTLRALADKATEARTVQDACALAARALEGNPNDLPFALLYFLDDDGGQARLAETIHTPPESPATIDPDGLDRWQGRAVLLPLSRAGAGDLPAGFLVAGLSPRLAFDDDYRGFLEVAAGQIANAIANARAYEEERRRAEALAELDLAKTAFFSNVSHEFRTPLTLMLGPLEELLAEGPPPASRDRLEVAHRSALRLLKLVNTLLDFSRIEAGRIQAVYEPTDLAVLTSDLSSGFRSAVERAGLRLLVDCPPLDEPVWVDREMWEKIVLNLLSNAFKFTFEGVIEIRLRREGDRAVLTVRDTGTGIPAEELTRIFERFHRVKDARGRTFEGSGIGLSLVQELVKLHGGTVEVESELDRGTAFTVRIPTGKAHLPADRMGAASTSLKREAYVEESLRWLPAEAPEPRSPKAGACILLADDNADMRQYVQRLLGREHEVVAVADGEEALRRAREEQFDLVLADVMMPRLDGFGLLAGLRSDERTKTLPIILLSARAGEEAQVEGMEAGADDYLVKPFSAKELLARVDAHLRLQRIRREAEQSLRESDRRKDEFLAMLAHELRNPLAPIRNAAHVLKVAGPLDDRQQWAREVIERQTQQLTRLVDDLLDVSRITRGKVALAREPLDLATIVNRAVETSLPLIEARRHQLDLALPPEPVRVDGDLTRLVQVVGNLLNNAAKYTDEGGYIRLEAAQEDGKAVIRVRDNGMGVPADLLPHVFDLFSQADRSLDRSQGGLGIGLTLVRRLVELHGGEVEARSEGPGQGSEFVVRLPA